SASRLDDWQGLWSRNRQRFLEKWTSDAPVPRIESCDPLRFARNRETARAVAAWMSQYFTVRDREERRMSRRLKRAVRARLLDVAHQGWRRLQPHLPARVADRLGGAARHMEA